MQIKYDDQTEGLLSKYRKMLNNYTEGLIKSHQKPRLASNPQVDVHKIVADDPYRKQIMRAMTDAVMRSTSFTCIYDGAILAKLEQREASPPPLLRKLQN